MFQVVRGIVKLALDEDMGVEEVLEAKTVSSHEDIHAAIDAADAIAAAEGWQTMADADEDADARTGDPWWFGEMVVEGKVEAVWVEEVE